MQKPEPQTTRPLHIIRDDLRSNGRAIAALADAAIDRSLRPDRTWRTAMDGLCRRSERLMAEEMEVLQHAE